MYSIGSAEHVEGHGIVTTCKGFLSQIGAFFWRFVCSTNEPVTLLNRTDMKLQQDEADQKRNIDFTEMLRPKRQVTCRRRKRGANISFALATKNVEHVIACGACETWLFRPTDIRHDKQFRLDLTDSPSVVSVKDCGNISLGPIRYKSDVSETWKYDVYTVRCRSCDVYLGLKVTRISNLVSWMEISSHGWCERIGAPLLDEDKRNEDSKIPRRGSFLTRFPGPVPVGGIETDQILLGTRYLRRISTKNGRACKRAELRCKGCENILSYSDQILCTR